MNNTTTAPAPKYLVMQAAACMPSNCWGRYRRVAVVEVVGGFKGCPAMISARARGVVRVVALWDKQSVGKTARCAFHRALAEAVALCARLNAEAVA
jgi:hypothetical protein